MDEQSTNQQIQCLALACSDCLKILAIETSPLDIAEQSMQTTNQTLNVSQGSLLTAREELQDLKINYATEKEVALLERIIETSVMTPLNCTGCDSLVGVKLLSSDKSMVRHIGNSFWFSKVTIRQHVVTNMNLALELGQREGIDKQEIKSIQE